jgi:hypothetical protein
MSVAELLTESRRLSRPDRAQLVQLLAQELAAEGHVIPGATYEVWSPIEAFDAAATMMQALAAEKGRP